MNYNTFMAKIKAEYFCGLVDDRKEKECIEYINDHNDFYDTEVQYRCHDAIYDTTPLNWTCYCGITKVAIKLIEYGADINRQEPYYNYTPLMNACMRERGDLVVELIKRGAKINIVNDLNQTALILSLGTYRRSHIAIELIQAGADIINYENHIDKYRQIDKEVRQIYRSEIIDAMNDQSSDNIMATSFRKTYVSGVIDMICEFIL